MTARTFTDLRNQLFSADHAVLAPAERRVETWGQGQDVYGVVMEAGLAGGSFLLFGLRDGSASLYLSSGGGSIGGQGRPHISAAAKKLVETARPLLDRFAPVSEHPIPPSGRVRFSIFTSVGVHAAEVSEVELRTGKHALSPLYAAGHAIITGFRVLEEREPANERSYLNCLLTALARGTGTSVTLDVAGPLPDPAGLTKDEADLEWIAKIGFDFAKLSQVGVIQMLERQAGFGSLQFWKSERTLNVRLAGHGGESFTDVTFLVRRRREGGRHQVEITVQRPG